MKEKLKNKIKQSIRFYLSLKDKEVKRIAKDMEKVKKEDTFVKDINVGIDTIPAWRTLTLKTQALNILLTFALIISLMGYHFLFPLKTTEYLTLGYKVDNDEVKVVDIIPAKDVSIDKLKLLSKYFIEDTVVKGLSNYRDNNILKHDLEIVKNRCTDEVLETIRKIQKQFEKEFNIATRQIVILESKEAGYGIWKIKFKTVDEDIRGQIYETVFNAKIVFDIIGLSATEKEEVANNFVKDNFNPFGLKIKGFYRLKETEED